MILVTRLNGPVFALNPDLIERADATPDTVVTLVDGSKYLIKESLHELMARVRDFRSSVIVTAHDMESVVPAPRAASGPATLVALPGGEA